MERTDHEKQLLVRLITVLEDWEPIMSTFISLTSRITICLLKKRLHDVEKIGKARYIVVSAMYVWQFQKALYVAEKNGGTTLCKDEKIGVIPYSTLAQED